MKHVEYLEPKTDVTFRKVFGENPELAIGFVNAVLPFENIEKERIETVKGYLRHEDTRTCDIPLECGPVSMCCINGCGKMTVVEIRLILTRAYRDETILASACTSAAMAADQYGYQTESLYSINLIDDTIYGSGNYCHELKLTDTGIRNVNRSADCPHLIFMELPEIKDTDCSWCPERGMWLRYFKEGGGMQTSAAGISGFPLIGKAVGLLDRTLYSDGELAEYTRFINAARTLKTAIRNSYNTGFGQGRMKGLEEGFGRWYREGVNSGIIAGAKQARIETARRMKTDGLSDADIIRWAGLKPAEIHLI